MPPEICPQCGAPVPEHAKACPECGSCEETGWSEKSEADRLGILDDSFNYNQYLEEEFGPPPSPSTFRRWIVPAVIVFLALLFLLGFILF